MTPLPRSFFAQHTIDVARHLLGQRLVRVLDGHRLSGLIAETEAYLGPMDQASHAYRLTPRSEIMYGPPGYAYVYFIYGTHFCLNAVTEPAGQAGAVLIRAFIADEGIDVMRAHRGHVSDARLTDGPGKLCQALAIDRSLNGVDLTQSEILFIEAGTTAAAGEILTTARIGVRGDEETRARPWRFVWSQGGGSRR